MLFHRLSSLDTAAFPCLSRANPYIASSLEVAAKKGAAPIYMPRLAAGDSSAVTAGCSAFAFQGTNAQVLLSR